MTVLSMFSFVRHYKAVVTVWKDLTGPDYYLLVLPCDTPVRTGPEAHPASSTMGTESFPEVRCGRGVTLTPHPLLVQRSNKE